MGQAIRVFVSYSHQDEDLQKQLAKHLGLLKRQGIITTWHDREILAGDKWAAKIDEYLQSSQIILLLVSADFINSDYCYGKELEEALKKDAAGTARIIPIILRPTDWQDAPFGSMQALPKDGKPVTTWANQDEAFLDIA